MKGFSSKDIVLTVMSYRTGKYTVSGCVRAYFSPENVQGGGAVKGLKKLDALGSVQNVL